MTSTIIPTLFRKSCQQHDQYPLKLVERARYGLPFLKLCQERFQVQQQRLNLFVPESALFVPYWDVSQAGVVDQQNLLTEVELTTWLGDDFQSDPADPNAVLGAKVDPQCRFIFLLTSSSIKPLEITPMALKKILSYYQVMPGFLDFLYVYGAKNGDDREITRFSGFRTEKMLIDPKPALKLDALNRSGKRYQMCYTFKTVALKGVDQDSKAMIDKNWKIRQVVVYHQFDVHKGTQLWIIGDPLDGVRNLIQEHVHEQKDHSGRYGTFERSFKSTLDTHLLYAQWANEEWRWHVQSSEEMIDNVTHHFIAVHQHDRVNWQPGALVVIQEREEKINDAIMALESNVAIMTRLRTFYTDLVEDGNFPPNEKVLAKQNVKDFASQLDEYIYDSDLQITRARLAAQLAKDRKEILIQHLSAQNATKQEAYTQTMWKQGKKSGLDAVTMKIITVIALVYLPVTFVSTFFSSDVVKYQDLNDDSTINQFRNGTVNPAPPATEKISQLALQRFFEVSVPLMLVTLGLAYGWYKWESSSIKKKERPFTEKYGLV